MNEIETVIKTFKEYLDYSDSFDDLQLVNQRHFINAAETAIKSIEEKQQREQGCEHCRNNGAIIPVQPCGNCDLGVRSTWLDNSIVIFTDKNTAAGYIPIKFCPFCGGRLNNE